MSKSLYRAILLDGMLTGLCAGFGVCAYMNKSSVQMIVAFVSFILWIAVQAWGAHLMRDVTFQKQGSERMRIDAKKNPAA